MGKGLAMLVFQFEAKLQNIRLILKRKLFPNMSKVSTIICKDLLVDNILLNWKYIYELLDVASTRF